MKLLKLLVSGIVISVAFASVASAGETACSTGSCKPPALPSYPSGGGVNNGGGQPNNNNSATQSTSNSNAIQNYGGSSVSNGIGVNYANQMNAAMMTVSGYCAYPVNSDGFFVAATVNGAPGIGGLSGAVGGGVAVGWNQTNYNTPQKSVDACNDILENQRTSVRIETCGSVIKIQRTYKVVINLEKIDRKLAETCQFVDLPPEVVQAPPAPPVVQTPPPVVETPPVVQERPPVVQSQPPVEYPKYPRKKTGSH
jgi:hypothetical protein